MIQLTMCENDKGNGLMKKTRIIAIEGIDGSGKGVQFKLLKERLLSMGYSVATRDYPKYESFFGREVGKRLAGDDGVSAANIEGKSMALWYALDRYEDLKDYQDGEADYLIFNRYVLSNAVYQSVRDIDIDKPDIVDWVMELEFSHFKLPKPDINLFFSVDARKAGELVRKKGFRDYVGNKSDVYERSSSIQERAREKYLECAERFDNIAVINCMCEGVLLPIEAISDKVLNVLKERSII